MKANKRNSLATIAIVGSIVIALILVLGTIWMGKSAKEGTETAVHSVSLLYLDELAGRRAQVVENNLQYNIDVIRVAVSLMTKEDLNDVEHLQAYQARMKQLFHLDKFAFVDRNGLIYTSMGTQTNIEDYDIDYNALTEPEISVLNPEAKNKKAVIAVPIEPLGFNGEELIVCFMEISMEEMLSGVSVNAQNTETTFCNIYTSNGFALSNTVLGGLAVEDNLLEALKHAEFDEGYSYEQVVADFAEGNDREVTFIKAKKEANKADLTGRRILLAEDVQVNAEIMMMVLQMRQMEADLAVNGKIAVEKFSEHEPGYYDAILMDMRMPEMDGLEATQAIRAMDRLDAKSIPIIALTANAFDEDVQRSMQAGLNAHLSKPVQPDTLYETLENLIHD